MLFKLVIPTLFGIVLGQSEFSGHYFDVPKFKSERLGQGVKDFFDNEFRKHSQDTLGSSKHFEEGIPKYDQYSNGFSRHRSNIGDRDAFNDFHDEKEHLYRNRGYGYRKGFAWEKSKDNYDDLVNKHTHKANQEGIDHFNKEEPLHDRNPEFQVTPFYNYQKSHYEGDMSQDLGFSGQRPTEGRFSGQRQTEGGFSGQRQTEGGYGGQISGVSDKGQEHLDPQGHEGFENKGSDLLRLQDGNYREYGNQNKFIPNDFETQSYKRETFREKPKVLFSRQEDLQGKYGFGKNGLSRERRPLTFDVSDSGDKDYAKKLKYKRKPSNEVTDIEKFTMNGGESDRVMTPRVSRGDYASKLMYKRVDNTRGRNSETQDSRETKLSSRGRSFYSEPRKYAKRYNSGLEGFQEFLTNKDVSGEKKYQTGLKLVPKTNVQRENLKAKDTYIIQNSRLGSVENSGVSNSRRFPVPGTGNTVRLSSGLVANQERPLAEIPEDSGSSQLQFSVNINH